MKRGLIVATTFVLGASACAQNKIVTNQSQKEETSFNDYFLCKCLYVGFGSDSLSQKDNTLSYYNELLLNGEKDLLMKNEIDSFVGILVKSIPVSPYNNKRAIVSICIEHYKKGTIFKMFQP